MKRFVLKKFLLSGLLLPVLLLPINNHISYPLSENLSNRISSSMDLINAVNSLRISNGLPAYQINQTLMYIAQTHSDYQASIGTTTHYGPDGSRPFQRALAAGYPVAGDLSMGGYFSENIIAGRDMSALEAVVAWQLDDPHLKTMLSSTLQDIGAGSTIMGDIVYYTIDVGLSANGKIYSTQEIGVIPTYNLYTGKKISTSTPGIDGSIYHIVDFGDTIWSISQAYQISEEEFIQMNSLTNDYIYVGDKFIIRPPYTPMPTLTQPSSTSTKFPTQITPKPTATTQEKNIYTASPLSTGSDPDSSEQYDIILIVIISLTLLASGVITFLGKNPKIN